MLGVSLTAAAAQAADATGIWLRDNGISKVKVAPCGNALCGHVVWLKEGADPNAKIGQRVFYEMKPDGKGNWTGKAFNPADGQTYSGKMSVSGSTLTTAGCVMGGMICRSVNWTRAN